MGGSTIARHALKPLKPPQKVEITVNISMHDCMACLGENVLSLSALYVRYVIVAFADDNKICLSYLRSIC